MTSRDILMTSRVTISGDPGTCLNMEVTCSDVVMPGEAGEAGPKGENGPTGPQGERGDGGYNGFDGRDGMPGEDGEDLSLIHI